MCQQSPMVWINIQGDFTLMCIIFIKHTLNCAMGAMPVCMIGAIHVSEVPFGLD